MKIYPNVSCMKIYPNVSCMKDIAAYEMGDWAWATT